MITYQEYVSMLMKQLKMLFTELYPPGEHYKIAESDNSISLLSPHFILTTFYTDEIIPEDIERIDITFSIFYEVGIRPQTAAESMRIISSVIPSNCIQVCEEFYVNKETSSIHYSTDAVEEKTKVMYKSVGKYQCPICDGYFTKANITTDGLCKHCSVIMPGLIFH